MKGGLARVGLDNVGAEGGVGREEVGSLGGRGVSVGGVVEVGVDVWVVVAVDGVAVEAVAAFVVVVGADVAKVEVDAPGAGGAVAEDGVLVVVLGAAAEHGKGVAAGEFPVAPGVAGRDGACAGCALACEGPEAGDAAHGEGAGLGSEGDGANGEVGRVEVAAQIGVPLNVVVAVLVEAPDDAVEIVGGHAEARGERLSERVEPGGDAAVDVARIEGAVARRGAGVAVTATRVRRAVQRHGRQECVLDCVALLGRQPLRHMKRRRALVDVVLIVVVVVVVVVSFYRRLHGCGFVSFF